MSAEHPYRSGLKAAVVIPRRLGELALLGGLVLIASPLAGWHAVGELSPRFLGTVLMIGGAGLLFISLIVRNRYRSHHARMHPPKD